MLYKTIFNFDKGIARRYDNMSGSRYFLIVAKLLMEGLLQEADLEEFSSEMQQNSFHIWANGRDEVPLCYKKIKITPPFYYKNIPERVYFMLLK